MEVSTWTNQHYQNPKLSQFHPYPGYMHTESKWISIKQVYRFKIEREEIRKHLTWQIYRFRGKHYWRQQQSHVRHYVNCNTQITLIHITHVMISEETIGILIPGRWQSPMLKGVPNAQFTVSRTASNKSVNWSHSVWSGTNCTSTKTKPRKKKGLEGIPGEQNGFRGMKTNVHDRSTVAP